MITGDEKMNYPRQERVKKIMVSKRQTIANPGLIRNKLMLCVWWDWEGIIHYDFLTPGKIINSDICCQQLLRLKEKVEKRRPELINTKDVVFYHDNAKPHTCITIQQIMRVLGWEELIHPPYSPDFAPSDIHMFRSLQNFLDRRGLLKLLVAISSSEVSKFLQQ
ncbi:Mariner Mos1 transposase [Eumeta japonica]|uniref:Mariner Mos1 transposase n=1 Tax=Eumeta variegata TaxID=151549 RepID=A0A4C1Z0Z6_EUMVA|nr:Mariner Mos1 transposase [Eumeta japonica]